MKKQLTAVLCMFISICQAQTLEVSYLEKSNASFDLNISEELDASNLPPGIGGMVQAMLEEELQKEKDGREYILQSFNGESIYQRKENEKNTNPQLTISSNEGVSVFYRSFEDKKTIAQANILSKPFLIHEDEVSFNWQINNETEQIGEYKCKKATSNVEDSLTVWFTSEVPINAGPKHYCGLPGLIVKVVTKSQTITTKNVKISHDDINIEKPTKGKEVSREKYNKILAKKNNLKEFDGEDNAIKIKIIK